MDNSIKEKPENDIMKDAIERIDRGIALDKMLDTYAVQDAPENSMLLAILGILFGVIAGIFMIKWMFEWLYNAILG